jgi:hypothetical protein
MAAAPPVADRQGSEGQIALPTRAPPVPDSPSNAGPWNDALLDGRIGFKCPVLAPILYRLPRP